MAQQPTTKQDARKVPEKASVTADPTSRKPSWLGRDLLWGLLLLLAVCLTYSPVCWAGFIWDDYTHLTGNPCIIGPLGLTEIWTTKAASICPLVLTTFWVEHAIWGLNPLPYHLVNVLLQGACAVVLWRVLRNLQVPAPWLGAALWALHPLQVESVAWISEMKNTQSCLFYLLAILFFVKSLRTRMSNETEGRNYALTLLFAALAIASKFSTVILPLVLALCAWWVEGRWQWRTLIRLAPIFLMSVVASGVTYWLGTMESVLVEASARSWPERVAATGDVIWFYVGKLIWPHPLMAIYPRWQIDAGQWSSYLPLLAAIIVLFVLWLKRETWARACFFSFAYFLIVLLPFLGLIDQSFWRLSFVEDHLQYLAAMGPLALVGAGLVRLIEFIIPEKRALQLSLGSGLLLLFGALSWQRAWAYENEETLWNDNLTKNPACWVGHNNLGFAHLKTGQIDDAMAHFQKGLELNSNDFSAHLGLGIILDQKSQVDEAILHYRKAIEINPIFGEALVNLGNALLQKHQADEAIVQYQKAVAINPNIAGLCFNLGNAYLQKGKIDEAIAQYEKAVKIDPTLAAAHNNLGNSLRLKGRFDEAIVQFQQTLDLDPNLIDAHYNLGLALLEKGRTKEAIAEFQKVLQLNPGDRDAQNHIDRALEALRQKAGP